MGLSVSTVRQVSPGTLPCIQLLPRLVPSGGNDIHIVGTARSPVIAGALAIVVLPRRAETGRQAHPAGKLEIRSFQKEGALQLLRPVPYLNTCHPKSPFFKPPHDAAHPHQRHADANTDQVWDLAKRAPAYQCAIRPGSGLLTL